MVKLQFTLHSALCQEDRGTLCRGTGGSGRRPVDQSIQRASGSGKIPGGSSVPLFSLYFWFISLVISLVLTKMTRRVVFVALGSRGDVQPLAVIANALSQMTPSQPPRVAFVTHTELAELAHKIAPLAEMRAMTASCFLGDAHDLVNPVCVVDTHGRRKKEWVQCVELSRDADLLVCNIFGFPPCIHLAEKLGIRCVCCSPCLIPYSMPDGFEKEFKEEFADLHAFIQDGRCCITWDDVLSWLWPVFTQGHGQFREHFLQLPNVPFLLPGGRGCQDSWVAAPKLFIGIDQALLNIARVDGTKWRLPCTACVCGFWDLAPQAPVGAPDGAPVGAQDGLDNSNQVTSVWPFGSEEKDRPVFVTMGSMGRHGLVEDSHTLLESIRVAVRASGKKGAVQWPHWFDDAAHTHAETQLEGNTHTHTQEGVLKDVFQEREGSRQEEGGARTVDMMEVDGERVVGDVGAKGGGGADGTLVRVCEDISYAWAFPRCCCVVHHGGIGTTAECLRAGVPQVIVPIAFDQPFWGDVVSRARVGAVVHTHTRADMTAALSKALSPHTHTEALRWQRNTNTESTAVVRDEITRELALDRPANLWRENSAMSLRVPVQAELDGLEGVRSRSVSEAAWVHHEIFVQRVYTPKGIRTWPGMRILDVGGGIGLFSIFARKVLRAASVWLFEPAPESFALCVSNIEAALGEKVNSYGAATPAGKADCTPLRTPFGADVETENLADVPGVTCVHCALGAETGEAEMLFFPDLPSNSTMRVHEDLKRRQIQESGAFNPELDTYLFSSERVERVRCEKLSDVMRCGDVSLLKVDVEGSELDVLAGIADSDWGRIHQITMEIHSPELLHGCTQTLSQRYTCVWSVEQDIPGHYMLYATRAHGAP